MLLDFQDLFDVSAPLHNRHLIVFMSLLCFNSYNMQQVSPWIFIFPQSSGRSHPKLGINSSLPGLYCFHSAFSSFFGDSYYTFHASTDDLFDQQLPCNTNISCWSCPSLKFRSFLHLQDNHHSPVE